VTELVDEGDVANALSLNTAVMTGSRVFGPALAGLLVASVGTGWCFLANAVSFVAVLLGLLLMNTDEIRIAPPTPRHGRAVRDGLGFVWRDPVLRVVFVLLVVVSTFAFNYQVSLALLNRKLHGGKASFGWLLAVNSVGSVIGSLVVASWRKVALRHYFGAIVLLGAASVAIGASVNLLMAFLVSVPLGIGGSLFIASSNALVQPRTPQAMRGRVLALQSTAFLGSTPIGSPITGWIGDHVGAGWSVAYGGLAALVAVAIVAALPTLSHRRTEAAGAPT